VGIPPAALTGMQMKLEMDQTWACDRCFAEFQRFMVDARKKFEGHECST